MPEKTRSARTPRKAPDHTGNTPLDKPSARAHEKLPRNHRELAQAIFAECDPVVIGRELLESDSGRASTVKARVWETLVDFAFGKQEPAAGVILSVHHYAIGALFVCGVAAFAVGWKLRA